MDILKWLQEWVAQHDGMIEPLLYAITAILALIACISRACGVTLPKPRTKSWLQDDTVSQQELPIHPLARVIVFGVLCVFLVPAGLGILWFIAPTHEDVMLYIIVGGLGILGAVPILLFILLYAVYCPVCRTHLQRDSTASVYFCPHCHIRWTPSPLSDTMGGKFFAMLYVGLLDLVMISFFMTGLVSLFFSARSVYYAQVSRAWPTTTGTVTASQQRSWQSGKSGPFYRALITYEYTVTGEHYTARRVSFGAQSSFRASPAVQTMKRYPYGAGIQVFYHPKTPRFAVLEPGKWDYKLLLYGVFFTAIGGIGGVFISMKSAVLSKSVIRGRQRPQ